MRAANFAYASRALLCLVEEASLLGSWSWSFADDAHAWSPGLFGLLGLEPGWVRPHYDLLLSLVHPEDRPALETMAEVRQEGGLFDRSFRIIRPNGALRVVSSHGELFVAPDGRPLGAAGLLLDVTDAEAERRVRAAEHRRARALFDAARTYTSVSAVRAGVQNATPSPYLLELTGLSRTDVAEDFFQAVRPETRAEIWERSRPLYAARRPFTLETEFVLAGGGHRRFRPVFVPLQGPGGETEAWAALVTPADRPAGALTEAMRRGLEQAVQAPHLRAARALLGWSMADLARAAGLSLSTVRRLEEDAEGPTAGSRHRAVGALRTAGIRFSLLGSALSVARV